MNRYWNPAGAANWNATTSWSDTDGGATGASVPTIDDDVFFTGTNVNNCTINSSPVMNSLTTSGYTGTITGDTTTTRVMGIKESITSTGTLKLYGNSTTARLMLRQTSTNAAFTTIGDGKLTITVAGIETAYVDFENCIGAGTADWDLTKQATDSSGDCGGNSGITFTTAATQTWTDADGGNWNDAGNWSGRVPLPQDDCNLGIAFNESKTVTPNMARLGKNITFAGATWTTALTLGTGITTLFGSLTFASGMTVTTSPNSFIFRNFTPATLTTNGVDFRRAITIVSYSTISLSDNLTATGNTVSIREGTFDTNGYVCAINTFTFAGGTANLRNETHTLTGNITTNGGNVIGNYTLKYIGSRAGAGAVGGTADFNLNKLWIDDDGLGGLTGFSFLSAGNINEFKDTTPIAHILSFKAGGTYTFGKFDVNGSAGNLVTIQSGTVSAPSTDVHYLVKKTRGETVSNYLNVNESIARPTKAWFAGNSTDGGGNNGWIFKIRGKRIMHNAIV
jgi:hypothetical protein